MRIQRSLSSHVSHISRRALLTIVALIITLAISIAATIAYQQYITHTAASANTTTNDPTPEECFVFDADTGTITDYGNEVGWWGGIILGTCPTDVVIPSTIAGVAVTTIGNSAFSSNQLTTVNIPNSVTTIGNNAFSWNQLTTLPAYFSNPSVTTLPDGIFSGNQFTELVIPSNITTIGNHAFSYNQLTTLQLPDSVTTIGNHAFYGNQLTTLQLPDSVTTIGNSAFTSNQLTTITIPSSVTTIGNNAFSYNQLTTLPAYFSNPSVTTLPHGIFSGNQFTELVIPSNITTIGAYAFYDNQLTTLQIPNSVTIIGNSAFSYNQLTTVHIPATVTEVGLEAFAVNQLSSVTLEGDINNPAVDMFGSGQLYRTGHVFYGNPMTQAQIDAMDLSTVEFIPVYTTDPTNPYGYTSESIITDVDGDGIDDSFGGTLVNPAQITTRYLDQQGNELHPSDYTVSPRFASYLASENPDGDVGPGSYYFAGESYTATAPAIDGYDTPANQTITLDPGANTVTFVYGTGTVVPGEPTEPADGTDIDTGQPANPTTPTTPAQGDELAETGASVGLVVVISTLLLSSGILLLVRRKHLRNV